MTIVVHIDLGKEWRGGQRQVYYLIEEQIKRTGLQIYLASPYNTPLLTKVKQNFTNVKTIGLYSSFEFDLRNIFKLYSYLNKKDFNIILHTHDAKGAGLGYILKKIFPHIKLIHTRRVSYKIKKIWAKRKYYSADLIVGVSKDICTALKLEGLNGKIVYIPSSIKKQRYVVKKDNRWHNPLRLGVIGALSPQKGHELLLRTLVKLNLDFELWIIGSGKLERFLQNLVHSLQLTNKVKFLGFVESNKVLSQLDILIVPSVDGEGSSATIKEGWASGVPVIASDLEANLELIKPNINGLIFKRKDPSSLLELIKKLLNNSELYEKLKATGLQEVNQYSPVAMEQAYWKIYNKNI
ncbi:Glycosyltransferase involved in cell wall bisynthesis [Desulfonauticus submarinus]|uniref:Glycosyltransferase involved in cell wall bisynthesis n=1 Tax=Desulfonauticus submarinus TaxID=206665 RepID=A0A1H0FMS5_9BACT|nr:glycosyltransferase family 4 protein [Desulfonauticus submarinus]SDN95976.1 Glycosyltransferase involved in cell wall bisynthesis [Desulfonauticus submarinus]